MDEFQVSMTNDGVWIMFEKDPTLADIDKARKMLNELTDTIIERQLDASPSIK